ncbi:class I SAM-dependent DNA methyltransferase [Solwaraspora sp. WMMB335]|uniref:class I SAM-dependent DNA methyltransferase n=1 Tax=Solwaraspora sp. WMMB335 TaxID=3404118 RepID=UPI003B9313FE
MSFDALTNRGEYLSPHYLAEVLPTTLKGGLLKRWAEEEKSGRVTPRAGLRGMRRDYFDARTELADTDLYDAERLRKLHDEVLRRLGFDPAPQLLTVERSGQDHEVRVAHAEVSSTGHGIVALDCGWAVDTDAAQDPGGAGRLLDPFTPAGGETITTGQKLASWLFAAEQPNLRYVLILSGGVITLADRAVWGEGRYLAVSLDTAYARNDERELDVVAALFGADSLRPPAEGGSEPLADLVAGSRSHAVGVSGELRQGLRDSVELIANEVLDRIREAGFQPQEVMQLDELAKELGREALRYLYRILFLLYAEARPELGVLPVDDPEYVSGYSMARLGDLVARRLPPSAENGFHLYQSLDLLFAKVNKGHRQRDGVAVADDASDGVGLRFEPLRSDLFLPEKTHLIGRRLPRPDADPDDPAAPTIDTRLRNITLYQVLRRLMLTKGGRKRRGGFISYAQLGINQLGAVYEGLMSYTGFVATEMLYEVAKHGDPKDGSWMIPASKADEYDDSVFVYRENLYTGVRSRVSYEPGQFVWRLAGRDRQTSASYYTPQSLTEVTVQLALKYRLDQDGTVTRARELLDWTICEPALGSGAFLNEAINQVAAEYLRRRQKELGVSLDPEAYHLELQRVKAYIALHNSYGVDLNRTAVELAEVSIWLNVMHAGLQAPWFGLHLRRGNSLIGGARKLYDPKQLADKSWLTTAPQDRPFRDGDIEPGTIHHFLLPADGWGAVAGEKEARELAKAETERLRKWRTAMRRTPNAKGSKNNPSQVARLQALAGRVEFLWTLVRRRLALSEQEIRRHIPVWGADDLPPVTEAVPREEILADLTAAGTPYWRLKTLMDTWCALWFWPLDKVGLLDGSDQSTYPAAPVEVTHVREEPSYADPVSYEAPSLWGEVPPQQLAMPLRPTGTRKVSRPERIDRPAALASLDDWLTFAEALVGRHDIPADSLVSGFTKLEELTDYEDSLIGPMGMEQTHRLPGRFPWLSAAETIADQQGFFHWELTFAHTFANGGFDLQVGNPPWVRPDWTETVVLAELDPWLVLHRHASAEVEAEWRLRLVCRPAESKFYLDERAAASGLSAFVGSGVEYQILGGARADFYRCFIVRVWRHASVVGVSGLLHPDTHLTGPAEGALRPASYRRLRIQAGFVNVSNWAFAPPVGRKQEFGLSVYGSPKGINFLRASKLFSVKTFMDSLADLHGVGPLPAIKNGRDWDIRAHRDRLIRVDVARLKVWRQLLNRNDLGAEETPLLHPVTTAENAAMEALARARPRLSDRAFGLSSGFNERTDRVAGLFDERPGLRSSWNDVIIKGPNFSLATPFAKQEPNTGNFDFPVDLELLPRDFLPATQYIPASDRIRYESKADIWFKECENPRKCTDLYRVFWREMTKAENERSLFPAIFPPGPTHVHSVRSMARESDKLTVLTAGFWASLPLDYLLRVTGREHMSRAEALVMPVPDEGHPLELPLLLRALRLNCLTESYGELWSQLYSSAWRIEDWAIPWPSVGSLGDVSREWGEAAPLRTDLARRSALIELDALVAVWLGMTADSLVSVYRSRYGTLAKYEVGMYFDAAGRRIASERIVWGRRQRRESIDELIAYLEDPERNPVPGGYAAPFYKADRENEYRQAHAVFSKRLQDAIDAGWEPS